MTISRYALPLFLFPVAAQADVTPQDVWDNMVAGYGAVGIELTASLDATGDVLTVNDGMATLTYPIIGGQMTATLPAMTLTSLGDGTVQIDVPGTYVSEIRADIPEEDGQAAVDLTIALQGFDSVASGDPGDVTYTSEAADFDLLVSNLVIPGESFGTFEGQFDSEGYSSETRVTVADVVTISTATINRPSVFTLNVESEDFRQESTSTSGTLTSSGEIVVPADVDIMNLSAALRNGLAIDLTSESEGGTSETRNFDGDRLISDQTQTTGAGTANFVVNADGLSVDGTNDSLDLRLEGSEMGLPFPIEVSVGDVGVNMQLPLLANDAAQPFAYGFSIDELTVADDIWNLIDGGQALDRSPVDLTLDLSGDLLVSSDLVDPATWEAMDQGVVPVEPVSLMIGEIAIAALGAAVNANGAFTFDSTDLQTFGGMPRPEGSISATATGLNAAMDQLVATGIVGAQDVQMPRMFMGMFAVSTGDDSLETELEINAEGHVILNGQRIQ